MSEVVPFTPAQAGVVMEQVLLRGDLSQLTHAERVRYLIWVCESLGLNPLTKPFEYIMLNGKLTLYAGMHRSAPPDTWRLCSCGCP